MIETKTEICIQGNSCIGKLKYKVKNLIQGIFPDALNLTVNSTTELNCDFIYQSMMLPLNRKNCMDQKGKMENVVG